MDLTIRFLGTWELLRDGLPFLPTLPRKEQWLLALLILRHDRWTERTQLAATLWPDAPESQAAHYLRRSLSHLRSILGEDSWRLTSPTPRTLRFDVTDTEIDVLAFDAACSDPASLNTAVALYRGPLLEGCQEIWILPDRVRREQAYLTALEQLAARDREAGEWESAIRRLKQIIATDPGMESAQAALMQAYAAHGDYAAVTQTYHAFRRYLHDSLHSQPAAETTALYQSLLNQAQSPVPETAAVPKTSYFSVPQPEHPLLGRQVALENLRSLLRSGQLVTLTGVGGVGKTRLAIEAGWQGSRDFPDGIWFVPLTDMTEPARIVEAIHGVLGLSNIESSEEQIVRRLSGKTALFILDNMEQLLPAGGEIVQRLWERCKTIAVLVTSRQALPPGPGETLALPPLAVPPTHVAEETPAHSLTRERPSPERLLDYAALQLYLERARTLRPNVAIEPAQLREIARLCTRLDGIPLAIELAAAWAKLLTPTQMLRRLNRRFSLLETYRDQLPERHRSLQAVLESGTRLLPMEVQRFFACLSVFRGGWTLEAAEAVCQEPRALEYLSRLHDASLIVIEEKEGEMRYRFLETIREFAEEQLERTGNQDRFRLLHRDFFFTLAEEARRHQGDWYKKLDTERENLRTAMDTCLNTDDAETGLKMANALYWFWERRYYLEEGRYYLETFMRRSTAPDNENERIIALTGTASLVRGQNDFDRTFALLQEGLERCQAIQDRQLEARILVSTGATHVRKGDGESALPYFEQALTLCRVLGMRSQEGHILNNTGWAWITLGDDEKAQTFFHQSIAVFREIGNDFGLQFALNNLGNTYKNQGKNEAAIPCIEQALMINRRLGYRGMEAMCLWNLANIAYEEKHWSACLVYHAQLKEILLELDNRIEFAKLHHEMGKVKFWQGDYLEALSLCKRSLSLYQQLGEQNEFVPVLDSIAALAFRMNITHIATALFQTVQQFMEQAEAESRQEEAPWYAAALSTFVPELKKEASEDGCIPRALTLTAAINIALEEWTEDDREDR